MVRVDRILLAATAVVVSMDLTAVGHVMNCEQGYCKTFGARKHTPGGMRRPILPFSNRFSHAPSELMQHAGKNLRQNKNFYPRREFRFDLRDTLLFYSVSGSQWKNIIKVDKFKDFCFVSGEREERESI